VGLRGASRLAASLAERRGDALLFKDLATLRTDAEVGTVDAWRWKGPAREFAALCTRLRSETLARRADDVAARIA
jgi:hypothetical protein